jgi:two-component system LytT family response regulator
MNCLIVDDDFASREIIAELLSNKKDVEIIDKVESAFDAIDTLKNEAIDLIILDIDMPGMSGIEMMQSLKNPPMVILVTGNKEHALEAYSYQVIDYIVKPVDKVRFLSAVDTALEKYNVEQPEVSADFLFVKKDGVLFKIFYRDIINIEAMADYICIYTANKKYLTLSTMHRIEKKLPSAKFIRVHRSHIINIQHVDSIEDGTANLGAKMIPVGKSYKQRLFKTLNVI